MKKNKVIISILILCFISIITLTACDDRKNSNGTIEKVSEELEYLDVKIVNILNKLNNITLQNYNVTSEEITLGKEEEGKNSTQQSSQGEQKESGSQEKTGSAEESTNITSTQMKPNSILQSDQNDIDWNAIKAEIETINNAWGIVLLDLSSLNIDNNDILSFSKILDDCIMSIKDENKVDSLTNLANLYSLIPKFESAVSSNNSIQNIKQVKSNLINAYSVVEVGEWDAIETNISECEKTFRNIINDLEYTKNKEYKINKTYVLIKELQNSLSYQDSKLFYIKYKDILESINTL